MEIENNKRKYLLWTSSFHPRIGGLENSTKEYAHFIKKQGWDVQILTNRYPRSLPPCDYYDGLKIVRYLFLHGPFNAIRNHRLDLFFGWLIFKPLTLVRLILFFLKTRPKIVNLHFPSNQLFECYLLKIIFRFKLIISLHGNEVERMSTLKKSNLQYFFYNNLFNSSVLITLCSRYLLNEFLKTFPQKDSKKCLIVYNGVGELFLNQDLTTNKKNYAFTAARFVPKKGLKVLFKAFHQETDIPLLIAGGNLNDLNSLGLELKDGISLLGKLGQAKILNHLLLNKITIVPSIIEPYGIIIAEALCCGSPIVATNVGGISEVISLAKSGLNEVDKKVFNRYVKLVNPDCEAIRLGINEIIKNYISLKEYIKLIPKVRRQFYWPERLDEYHKALSRV